MGAIFADISSDASSVDRNSDDHGNDKPAMSLPGL
jgi:hypothetical protein